MTGQAEELNMTEEERELVDWARELLERVLTIFLEQDLAKRKELVDEIFNEIGDDQDKINLFVALSIKFYQGIYGYSGEQILEMLGEQHDA